MLRNSGIDFEFFVRWCGIWLSFRFTSFPLSGLFVVVPFFHSHLSFLALVYKETISCLKDTTNDFNLRLFFLNFSYILVTRSRHPGPLWLYFMSALSLGAHCVWHNTFSYFSFKLFINVVTFDTMCIMCTQCVCSELFSLRLLYC